MARSHAGQIGSYQLLLNFSGIVKDFRFHSKTNEKSLKAFEQGGHKMQLVFHNHCGYHV